MSYGQIIMKNIIHYLLQLVISLLIATNENSGKIKKAKDLGVRIISLAEFRAEY